MEQVIGKKHGVRIWFEALIDIIVAMFAKIGMYAAPSAEDEAAMYFCFSLDRMDW